MDLGLFQNIDYNRRRSAVLIAAAVLLLCALGGVLGAVTTGTPWVGIAVAAAVGALLSANAWTAGSSLVLAAAGAQRVRQSDDPVLVNVVEEMAIASGLPRPSVHLIDDDAPNAFATGIDPRRAAVAVTRGLREKLNRDELQGVVAHEMAHIGNYDTRVMVLLAVIVGSVAILSDMFLRWLRYGRLGRGRGRGNT
ncbi:MAG: M48 family metalloprotease, partial [Planctomycetota bacterium]